MDSSLRLHPSAEMINYPDSQSEFGFSEAYAHPEPPLTCSQGHRSSLVLHTVEGGSICLLCFSNLVSSSSSPTFHVVYALSQLSHAFSQPAFLRSLLSFHVHFIVSPLVHSLSSFNDEQIARQAIDLIVELCDAGDASVSGEFIARISDRLSSDALTRNHRQIYTLHCLGVLLSHRTDEAYVHIKEKENLVYNLIMGLQLPSEEIRGEILYVIYRILVLQCARKDDEGDDVLFAYGPKLFYLSIEVLLKSQSDEVRLNSIAVLKVLTQTGFLVHALSNDDNAMDICESQNAMQETDDEVNSCSLDALFAEAIKAPLLSPDKQVQSAALDLIFQCLSAEGFSVKHIQVMVEENIGDYIFEILRLSELKDDLVSRSIQVLYLLSTAEQIFWTRLAIGFTTLVSILSHIAEVSFHPVQTEMLKLILIGVTNCAGAVSSKHIEDISSTLTAMLRKHINGEMGMLSEAFTAVSSIFVALLKSPSSHGATNLLILIQQASKYALVASLSTHDKDPGQLLQSLFLLKAACKFDHEVNSKNNSRQMQIRNFVLELCQENLVPWFVKAINVMEEESVLGVLEILYNILEEKEDTQVLEFTKFLLSFSWFHFLFQCLGLYPSEKVKYRVYVFLSSMVDNLFGNDSGQPIREAASSLPMDPIDLLFLLGQKSADIQELSSCQSAVLEILYSSSFYNQTLADDKLILASLEQYILANSNYLLYGQFDSLSVVKLVSLYGQYRGLASCRLIPHSPEAESIFFKLVNERSWGLSFVEIFPTSLKWLFQQEEILDQLSLQIMRFCTRSISVGAELTIHVNNGQDVQIENFAKLVAAGDNYSSMLLVTLLDHLMDKESLQDEVMLVLLLMISIIRINPTASDQLCMRGIGIPIESLCCSSIYSSSETNGLIVLHFIFIILSTAKPEALPDDGAWLGVTVKLLTSLTSIPTAPAREWTREDLYYVSILSLILNHSTHQALAEASKTILLNSPLVSMVQSLIHEAAVIDLTSNRQDQATHAVGPLVFLLLLNCFYLRSLLAVIPGYADGQTLLPLNGVPSLPMNILCQDCCRLMHRGPPLLKLTASYCLVELFRQPEDLECTVGFFKSVVAALEGLVFHDDLRVATNSSICFSTVLSWEVPGPCETRSACPSKWCRFMVEELAMWLAAPCSVSKSFPRHHKSAIHVATALLKLNELDGWMRSVFDQSCMNAIIQNLSYTNITVELVQLLRELFQLGFCKPDQIRRLISVLQTCRKHAGPSQPPDACDRKPRRMVVPPFGSLETVCEVLVHLLDDNSKVNQIQLSQEIELFLVSLGENAAA